MRCIFCSQRDPQTLDTMQSGTSAWRAVARVLRSPVDSISCAIFPASCRLCGEHLLRLTRLPVCDSCWKQLPEQSGVLCAICGEAMGLHTFDASDPSDAPLLCRPCKLAAPPFAQAVAHGLYQGRLRNLLHLLKYDRMEAVANRLAPLLTTQIFTLKDLPDAMLVVPVPLHRAKRRQRGFNQADALARAAIRELRQRRPQWKLRLAPVLRRSRSTESQAGLTPHQRRANMRGAFFVPFPEQVKGADVLLIDDIYTTGATARACALALRRAGANSVRVATVARAQRQDRITQYLFQQQEQAAIDLPMQEDVAFWDSGFVPAVRRVD